MSSYRALATSLIGAAAICTTSIVTAGAVHAEPATQGCSGTPSSWVNGAALYAGFSFRDGEGGAGFQTILTITNMTVAGASANWAWDPAYAADSVVYDAATLNPQGNGTYVAETTGHTTVGGKTTNPTFIITPHCAPDGTVEALSVTRADRGLSTWTAELKRIELALETGNENQGKPNS